MTEVNAYNWFAQWPISAAHTNSYLPGRRERMKFVAVSKVTIVNIVEASDWRAAQQKIEKADVEELLHSKFQGWDLSSVIQDSAAIVASGDSSGPISIIEEQ